MDIATPVSDAVTPVSAKEDWVRRFAYRAMLCEPALDTDSAFMVAGALGTFMMGALFDHFHSYSAGLGVAAIATTLAVALLPLLGPYRFGPAKGPMGSHAALMEA